jgi:hypothetical protein
MFGWEYFVKSVVIVAAAILAASFPITGSALGRMADVQIFDREHQALLPVYSDRGQYYVAGDPGAEYEIRLSNRQGCEVLAVVSVDGVNVVSGETANWRQSGYVLGPWSSSAIAGWRKSLDQTAAFYFTRLRNSYAARTGRPQNVGVIGVALFESRQRPQPLPAPSLEAPEYGADAPAARGESKDANEARNSVPSARAAPRLGTGHGRREDSPASYVEFERASDSPGEIVVIHYDSYRNLVARGIIPHTHLRPAPEPFPSQFVPDPAG